MSVARRLRARWPTPLLLGIPVSLLLGAYIWLALEHGTWDLWQVIVHESGRYTLGQTVFFFRHFLREVPVDLAMGLFCAAAVAVAEPGARRRRLAGLAALLAVALVTLAFTVAVREEGSREAVRDLLQFRTRDDDAAYGAHWNFHLLSTIWFGIAAFAAAALWAGGGVDRPGQGAPRALLAVAWGWVIVLTLVFGVQSEVFTSARYIGHQAREILTHGLITLPLTVGLLRWASGPRPRPDPAGAHQKRPALPRLLPWVPAVAIPVFLVVAFRNADLAETAQMNSALAGVVAAHVFEHVLDMVLVVLVGLAAIGCARGPAATKPIQ